MSKLVTLTIDDKQVTVPEGTVIVDAAKKVGIDIPVFCYHPKMEPVGMCRMCLVDVGRPVIDRATGQPVLEPDGSPKVQFGPKLETACTTLVSEGMVVVGMSEKVKAGRKDVLEFLLTSHPLDCPVCDKGGECPLQNLTMGFGPGESRFLYDEKMHLAKHVPLGDLIFLDRERCIQCGRCVRFQSEVVDDPVIGFYNRGRKLEIRTYSDPGFDSYFSGNTSDICPVGALTTVDFRFGARPWEMRTTASICTHCAVGCNLAFNVRREAKAGGDIVIKRAMPRQNEQVNELWICDKGRFGYHFAESGGASPLERLAQPLVRRGGELQPASWDEALRLAAEGLHQAGRELLALVGGRLSNEDLFNIQALAQGLGGKIGLDTYMAGGDLVSQVGLGQGSNLGDLGQGSAILVVACDLEEEAPIWWLRLKRAVERGASLIVANPRPTKLERYAAHILRYGYGSEAATVAALLDAIDGKQNAANSGIKAAAEAITGLGNLVVVYGSEGLGLQGSQALAQACANLLIATGHFGQPNNGLLAVWPHANDQGAWEMGLRPLPDLPAALQAAKALYVAASDPLGDDPALAEALRALPFVVVQDLFLTETARLANVVLPALPFTERDGSFTSGERRVQRYYPAVLARPDARPDYAISGEICKRAGVEAEISSAAGVFARLAEKVPAYQGLNYRMLAQTAEQWPIVGRPDVYYGGTAYENTQGLGVQVKPGAQDGPPPARGALGAAPALPLQAGERLAVPVTRLYDHGSTIAHTGLLHARTPAPYVALHPGELPASDGAEVQLSLGGQVFTVTLRLDEALPAGVVLVPRSLGLPLRGPQAVELKVK
ncbi:MAG TPA: NADH-quinone oxidoreductase subunit NuoG [Anaerolineales bacterium]|nr:NADH-quinone oxidoreductase subunit NuoG [Anaerolineales bacterium]